MTKILGSDWQVWMPWVPGGGEGGTRTAGGEAPQGVPEGDTRPWGYAGCSLPA